MFSSDFYDARDQVAEILELHGGRLAVNALDVELKRRGYNNLSLGSLVDSEPRFARAGEGSNWTVVLDDMQQQVDVLQVIGDELETILRKYGGKLDLEAAVRGLKTKGYSGFSLKELVSSDPRFSRTAGPTITNWTIVLVNQHQHQRKVQMNNIAAAVPHHQGTWENPRISSPTQLQTWLESNGNNGFPRLLSIGPDKNSNEGLMIASGHAVACVELGTDSMRNEFLNFLASSASTKICRDLESLARTAPALFETTASGSSAAGMFLQNFIDLSHVIEVVDGSSALVNWLAFKNIDATHSSARKNLQNLASKECFDSISSCLTDLGDNAEAKFTQASIEKWMKVAEAPIDSYCKAIFFNPKCNYRPMSVEIMQHFYPEVDTLVSRNQPVINQDIELLLCLLPGHFRTKVECNTSLIWQVRDIILDLGQRPYLLTSTQERTFLCDDENVVVGQDVLQAIEEKLAGKFGPDNRAGFDRQLHRISAMRNRQNGIYSFTMRVGRSVTGNAGLVDDILYAQKKLSVLLLGRPGSGKTTIVREIARKLSTRTKSSVDCQHVLIVDTSNEIAGDGDIVHPSVGMARRMMVPNLDKQGEVMIETLQNHTPDVIIVDEIGRAKEVSAAKTVKERGVRLIASAHGDFRSLIRNPQLNGLVGGVSTVILGDAEAAKTNNGNKTKTERGGKPIFDVIIELRPYDYNHWTVIPSVSQAVDNILQGRGYTIEHRDRETNPDGTQDLYITKMKQEPFQSEGDDEESF